MPFWRSFAHLVWTTKNREPLIRPSIEAPLYAALVATAAELGCYVHAVNGIADHVHLIISIPPKHSVSTVVKHLKGSSSHFVNHELQPGSATPFAWQRGYGYLSLGKSQCERAIAYVRNQKQHHPDGTTNGWLERVDDEDEVEHPGILRERPAEYGLPF
jgi:REP element-mobilizing transposase RayT